MLEDLGSTNGTFVDGQRITAATRITPTQEITIGQTVPMPWPSDLVKFVRIGRVPGNDIVLDDLRVSSRHARLMIVGGNRGVDRGSRLLERHLSELCRHARHAADAAFDFGHGLLRQPGRSRRAASGWIADRSAGCCCGESRVAAGSTPSSAACGDGRRWAARAAVRPPARARISQWLRKSDLSQPSC